MLFEKEVTVKGIPAYRYTPPRDVLASGKNNPENEGFCLDKDCLDDGVLNVAVCRKGNATNTTWSKVCEHLLFEHPIPFFVLTHKRSGAQLPHVLYNKM